MEPAWTQFESEFVHKVNIAHMNVDEKTTAEMKRYGTWLAKAGGGIPYPVWLDAHGIGLDQPAGAMTAQQLSQRTSAAEKKSHP